MGDVSLWRESRSLSLFLLPLASGKTLENPDGNHSDSAF